MNDDRILAPIYNAAHLSTLPALKTNDGGS